MYGFTLIEVLVVVTLCGIIMSTGLILSQSSIGHTYILSERDTLVSLLTTARGHSLANINQTPHGV